MSKKITALLLCSVFLLSACEQPSIDLEKQKRAEISEALIPNVLLQDLPGQDADTFLIFDNNDYIIKILNQNEPTKLATKIEDGVVVANFQNQALIGRVRFTDNLSANAAKLIVDNFVKTNNQITQNQTYESKVTDTILEFSTYQKTKELVGKFADNPSYQKMLTSNYLDIEMIAYFNNNQNPELMMGAQLAVSLLSTTITDNNIQLENSLPIADAQSFITANDSPSSIADSIAPPSKSRQTLSSLAEIIGYSQETIITFRPLENLYLGFQVSLPNQADLGQTALFQYLQRISSADSQPKLTDLQAAYQENLTNLKANLAELNIGPTTENRQSTVKTTLDNDNQLKVVVTIPMAEIEKSLQEAPIKARDASRKAQINNLIAGIEIYNSNENKYPDISSCIENLDYLKPYFKNNELPKDTSGQQTFGTTTCQNGYYYLACKNNNLNSYSLWAKMENPNSGNTNQIPDPNNANFTIKKEKSGQYYVYNQDCPETQTATPIKVRRITTQQLPI